MHPTPRAFAALATIGLLTLAFLAPATAQTPVEELIGHGLPLVEPGFNETLPTPGPEGDGDVPTKCDVVESMTISAGLADGFALPVDDAVPRPALEAHIPDAIERDFDQPGANTWLGHTFTGLPAQILTAHLLVVAKPEGGLSINDALQLQFQGTGNGFAWTRYYGAVGADPGLVTSGLWQQQGGTPISLDLGALLKADGSLFDLRPALNADGYLDLYTSDDTNIDHAVLRITYCACAYAEEFALVAGVPDEWSDGEAEPAEPRAAFAAMVTLGRDFDERGRDKHFGHSFVGLPTDVLAATLTVRARPEGVLAYNDRIYLQHTGGVPAFEWWSRIGTDPYTGDAGLLPNDWETYGPTTLPPIDLAQAGVLPSMNANGHLDVYVQDDTSIDHMVLSGVRCVCELYSEGEDRFEGGLADGYDGANGVEPATPGAALANYVSTWPLRDFDEPGADRFFAHTFDLDCRRVVEAYLEIRLRADHWLATNDILALQYKGGSPPYHWARSIGSTATDPTGLVGAPWTPGSDATVVLDLANLEWSTGQVVDLLPQMNADGRLDVWIQDDTAVDHATLHVVYG